METERVDEAHEVAEMLAPQTWDDEAQRYTPWTVYVISINAPVIVVGRSSVVLDINDWFSARLGYTRSEIIGRPLGKLLVQSAADRSVEYIAEWFSAGDAQAERPYSLGAQQSIQIRTASGALLQCEVSLHPGPRNRYAAAIVTPLENLSEKAQVRNRVLGILAVLTFCVALVVAPTYLHDAEELRLLGIGILGFIARDVVPGFLGWATGRVAKDPGISKNDATGGGA